VCVSMVQAAAASSFNKRGPPTKATSACAVIRRGAPQVERAGCIVWWLPLGMMLVAVFFARRRSTKQPLLPQTHKKLRQHRRGGAWTSHERKCGMHRVNETKARPGWSFPSLFPSLRQSTSRLKRALLSPNALWHIVITNLLTDMHIHTRTGASLDADSAPALLHPLPTPTSEC